MPMIWRLLFRGDRGCNSLLRLLVVWMLFSLGCASEVQRPQVIDLGIAPVVIGRVTVGLTGERSRKFEPELRWFELVHQDTKDRFLIRVEAEDQAFLVHLPTGVFQLTRAQIGEGPFLSMADYALTFEVPRNGVTYAGTWVFGVDSPQYGRRMSVVARTELEDQQELLLHLTREYPALAAQPVTRVQPTPSRAESRLYEVMPYPRYKYFRRHWW